MMDFLGPTAMNRSGAGFAPGPSRSVTSSDFGSGGNYAGYIRAGGPTASTTSASGGTLSGTVLTGFTTDAVLWFSAAAAGGPDNVIFVYIMGDAVAALAGLSAITIGGVPCAVSAAPAYDGTTLTTVVFLASAALVAPTSQTIQLI